MATVEIYFAPWCPYCRRALQLLDQKKVAYKAIDVDVVENAREEMQARGAGKSIPQIFINNQSIGGCDDLYALEAAGKLDSLFNT